MSQPEIKYLGYANGWTVDPPEITEHYRIRKELGSERDQQHPEVYIKLGNCHHEYFCPACKIRWRVDSSD